MSLGLEIFFGIVVCCMSYTLADILYYQISAKKDHITHRVAGQFGLIVSIFSLLAYIAFGVPYLSRFLPP